MRAWNWVEGKNVSIVRTEEKLYLVEHHHSIFPLFGEDGFLS